MVNATLTTDYSPSGVRPLVIAYAPPAARAALDAVLAFDDVLAAIPRGARDPAVAQMRFTWWHAAVSDLDPVVPPPAQPVLQQLARDLIGKAGAKAALLQLIEGWEVMIEPGPLVPETLIRFAELRGGGVAAAYGAALSLAPPPPVRSAMAGWALMDAAGHFSNPQESALAQELARGHLDRAFGQPWRRPWRALGAIALLARDDLQGARESAVRPRPVAQITRLLWHRLTGR